MVSPLPCRCAVLSGVPQGMHSPWPYSFLDLPKVISHSTIALFADDCIYCIKLSTHPSYDAEKLKKDLNSFQKMTTKLVNETKCYVMRVTHPRRNKVILVYKLGNQYLCSVDHHKYLGTIIQSDLKWHKHNY